MTFRVHANGIKLSHCICPTGGVTKFDPDREYVLQMIVLQSDDECRRVKCGTGSIILESVGAHLVANELTVAGERMSSASQWWVLTRLLSATRVGRKYRIIGESAWNPGVAQTTTLTQIGNDGVYSFTSTPRAIAKVHINALLKEGLDGLGPAQWLTTPSTRLCELEGTAYGQVYELGGSLLWRPLYQYVGAEYDGVPTAMVETGACRPGLVEVETILRMMKICGIEYCPPPGADKE